MSESQPLSGKRILITRAPGTETTLAEGLRALGAEPVAIPLIRIEPLDDAGAVEAVAKAGEYDCVVITSPNGADALMRLARGPLPRVASVGPATTARLTSHGIEVAVQPSTFHAEALAEELAGRDQVKGKRFLLVRGDRSTDALPKALRAAGGEVTDAIVYRTILAGAEAAPVLEEALAAGMDAISITSGTSAQAWVEALGADRVQEVMTSVPAIAIGPLTARSMKHFGLPIAAIAHPHTMEGLVEAVREVLTAIDRRDH